MLRSGASIAWIAAALASRASGGDTPTLRAHAAIVVVPVTVLDGEGSVVAGLGTENFRLTSDSAPLPFRLDTTDTIDAPVALVVAIQTAAGSAAALVKIRKIASMIVPLVCGDRGETAVVSYGGEVKLEQDFTTDAGVVGKAISQLHPGAPMAGPLIDAVKTGVAMLTSREGRRRVLLIIGESRDRGSKAKLDDVLPVIERGAVQIYAATYSAYATSFTARPSDLPPPEGGGLLAVFTELGRVATRNTTEALVRAGGGERFSFLTQKSLERLIARLSEHLHSQYLLSFTPPKGTTSGLHRIEVTLNDQPGYAVYARPAFFWDGE